MENNAVKWVEIQKLDIGYTITCADSKYGIEKRIESYETLDRVLKRAQELLDKSFDNIWK